MSFADASRLDRHAYGDSPIHRLDPRAKVLATLAFVLSVVSFDKYAVAPLLPFAAFPLLLAVLGSVPVGLLLRRLVPALPFLLLIGIFNPLLDRRVLVQIGGTGIAGGWVSFVSILVRGLLCVGAAIVLIATTSLPRVVEALGRLRCPRILVVQLLLLYRYLFLLMEEAGRMARGRALRAGRARISIGQATGMLSTLLLRTVERSEGVWKAMTARGFEGEFRSPRRFAWRTADTLFVLGVAGACLLLRATPFTHSLGLWILSP